jgi:hypothetical protein
VADPITPKMETGLNPSTLSFNLYPLSFNLYPLTFNLSSIFVVNPKPDEKIL